MILAVVAAQLPIERSRIYATSSELSGITMYFEIIGTITDVQKELPPVAQLESSQRYENNLGPDAGES